MLHPESSDDNVNYCSVYFPEKVRLMSLHLMILSGKS